MVSWYEQSYMAGIQYLRYLHNYKFSGDIIYEK